jgi:acid phosphatase type 7
MIDTETDFPNAPDAPGGSADLDSGPFASSPTQQLDFLAADLASVDRTVTPWLVVSGHRPWYTTGGGETCSPCQTAFVSVLPTVLSIV